MLEFHLDRYNELTRVTYSNITRPWDFLTKTMMCELPKAL